MAVSLSRVPVLEAMERDLRTRGSFRRRTAVAMYSAYAAHATAVLLAARRSTWRLPLPRRPVEVLGLLAMGAGGVLFVGGAKRFSGSARLTGTENEDLLADGLYHYSRNPQYLGILAFVVGLGAARRSGLVLIESAVLMSAYAAWVPVEERHLARTLGQPYLDYCGTTRRWWGRRATTAAPSP